MDVRCFLGGGEDGTSPLQLVAGGKEVGRIVGGEAPWLAERKSHKEQDSSGYRAVQQQIIPASFWL